MTQNIANKLGTSRTGIKYPPIESTRQYGKINREYPWDTGKGIAIPALVNIVPNSNNLVDTISTQGGYWWGDGVATFDQVGVEGAPNTASLVTASLNQWDAVVWDALEQTAPLSTEHTGACIRIFVKKDPAGITSVEWVVQLQANESPYLNSALWFSFNTATGVFVINSGWGEGFVPTLEVNSFNTDWWEIIINWDKVTTAAGISGVDVHMTGASATVAGNLIIGNVECYLDGDISRIRGSAPMYVGDTV